MLTTNFPFTTPSNYNFDPLVMEVAGGVARLKDLVAVPETFYANYNADINGSRGAGVLTGVAHGGATVSGGELDLAHDDTRYVDYDANLNADSQQTGCIRFKFTPNYNGANSTEQIIFCITRNIGSGDNNLFIRQRLGTPAGGYLVLHVYDLNGALIVEAILGYWVAVQGQEYEFELNYDFTTGETRFFKDGNQYGATITATGVRDNRINLLRIGSNHAPSPTHVSNFKIDDFQIFNAPQHTANYTPQPCPEYRYDINNPTISPATIVYADALGDITITDNTIAPDTLKFALEVSGNVKYHDGNDWVNSSGYTQTNTLTEINDNSGSLDIALGATIKPVVYFHSDTGVTTPVLDDLTMEYNFFSPVVLKPDICTVWGYIIGQDNEAVPNVSIKVKLAQKYKLNTDKFVVSCEQREVLSNVSGYFEFDLICSSEFEGDGFYSIDFTFDTDTQECYKRYRMVVVPDAPSVNFWDIIPA